MHYNNLWQNVYQNKMADALDNDKHRQVKTTARQLKKYLKKTSNNKQSPDKEQLQDAFPIKKLLDYSFRNRTSKIFNSLDGFFLFGHYHSHWKALKDYSDYTDDFVLDLLYTCLKNATWDSHLEEREKIWLSLGTGSQPTKPFYEHIDFLQLIMAFVNANESKLERKYTLLNTFNNVFVQKQTYKDINIHSYMEMLQLFLNIEKSLELSREEKLLKSLKRDVVIGNDVIREQPLIMHNVLKDKLFLVRLFEQQTTRRDSTVRERFKYGSQVDKSSVFATLIDKIIEQENNKILKDNETSVVHSVFRTYFEHNCDDQSSIEKQFFPEQLLRCFPQLRERMEPQLLNIIDSKTEEKRKENPMAHRLNIPRHVSFESGGNFSTELQAEFAFDFERQRLQLSVPTKDDSYDEFFLKHFLINFQKIDVLEYDDKPECSEITLAFNNQSINLKYSYFKTDKELKTFKESIEHFLKPNTQDTKKLNIIEQ